MYTDRTLTCADCGQEFAFSSTEQAFYADRGFTDPRRCPNCRAARKSQRNDAGGGSSYSSGGSGGGSSSYGAPRGYGNDRPPREMFPATCSSCGKPTQVPFKPTSGKPVYCSDCFRSR
jgi:CxxC-x17-CxxC domain-containing protein